MFFHNFLIYFSFTYFHLTHIIYITLCTHTHLYTYSYNFTHHFISLIYALIYSFNLPHTLIHNQSFFKILTYFSIKSCNFISLIYHLGYSYCILSPNLPIILHPANYLGQQSQAVLCSVSPGRSLVYRQ
jgi:hypothetical protein